IIGESPKLALYSYWQSSCSWRVRFALNLKGISYEYKAVNLSKGEQFTPEFEKLNPLHFVPVLVDGDVVVSDSYAILLVSVLNSNIDFTLRLATIRNSFRALEKLLKDINGKYATGDEVYMADVFMAPQIAAAMQRFKIDMSKYPRLCRIFESLKALLEFLDASPERQPDAVH
ncbi:hypothetical protein Gotur_034850, partial [Gossypium turneri]